MAKLSRRTILAGFAGVVATSAVTYSVLADDDRAKMTPPEVLKAARAGDVLFVDIRRPDEWAKTGIGEGAVPLDMRRPDFIEAVRAARTSANQPIALICARGVRSRRLTARLTKAGLTEIIDVPEGMLGSLAGPGWLKRNLPVRTWSDDS